MNYYAATLREPGEKLNNDGLMVKGIHLKDKADLVVIVLCSCKENGRLCDKVIRTAEKMVHKGCEKDVAEVLRRLYVKFGKKEPFIKRQSPEISVLIVKDTSYYAMNRGNNRMLRVGRFGAEELSKEKQWQERDGYSFLKGRLPEGSTLVVANPPFFERQLDFEIHKWLCPQMCTDEVHMQKNIERLGKQLWSRGEIRPVTAVALCVK